MQSTNTGKVTLAEAVVEALLAANVDQVFGVGGTHTLPLLGAIERSPAMRYVAARTELGATYMALGYARAIGSPAIALTSTGPGALNALSAIADTKWASLPLVHLTSSIRNDEGFSGAVHETPNQREVMQVLGKGCVTVHSDDVSASVDDAVRASIAAPPGPVTIDLPAGALGDPAVITSDSAEADGEAAPFEADLSELIEALNAAQRPILFVGGGVLRSCADGAVMRLAERLQAPVLTSYQGKAVSNWANPLYLGPWASEPKVAELCADADFALVLGSKLSSFGTDYWRLPLPSRTFRVDVQNSQHPKYPTITNCLGDVGQAVDALMGQATPKDTWAAASFQTSNETCP